MDVASLFNSHALLFISIAMLIDPNSLSCEANAFIARSLSFATFSFLEVVILLASSSSNSHVKSLVLPVGAAIDIPMSTEQL